LVVSDAVLHRARNGLLRRRGVSRGRSRSPPSRVQ
jgi:hypothetical protein